MPDDTKLDSPKKLGTCQGAPGFSLRLMDKLRRLLNEFNRQMRKHA